MVEIQSREASRDYVGIFGMFGIFGNRQWNSADTQGAATPGQREKETVGLFYCRLTTGSFSRKPGSSHWSMIYKLDSGKVPISPVLYRIFLTLHAIAIVEEIILRRKQLFAFPKPLPVLCLQPLYSALL